MIFEQAARLKIRFETQKGLLSAEDLWDLPLTSAKGANLDDIARGLYALLRSDNNVSFVNPGQKSDPTAQLRFDIAKHIIDVRIAENAAAATASANHDKKQRLLGIIAEKEGQALTALSVEKLRGMVAAL
jgi:hypothetical protein